MEKRLILAIGLSMLVLLAWSKIFPPPQPVAPAETVQADRLVGDDSREPLPPRDAPPPATTPTDQAQQDDVATQALLAIGATSEQEFSVEGDFAVVELTNRGGRVRSWKLVEYTTRDGQLLELPITRGVLHQIGRAHV